jgi:excinuclease ABC subunit C
MEHSGPVEIGMMKFEGSDLERRINSLPSDPGVYLWKNSAGDVIYVGKAARLKPRVRSYFSGAEQGLKHRALVGQIADVETIVVPSEPQSLLLEDNLIKEHQPRFNIALRDDKSYPSIAVTIHEDFPRVLVVRRMKVENARYFGPYTDVTVLRKTLKVIRRIFTVRSCHYRLMDERPERACLDYHIKRCLAPCVGKQSVAEYREMIDEVLSFLEGKTVDVRTQLRAKMEKSANALEYERAAEYRNSIKWLDQLETPQAIQIVGGADADAIGFARDGDDAVGVLMKIRKGKVLGREQRFLQNVADWDDSHALKTFITRHYLKEGLKARNVLLPFPPDDIDNISTLLEPAQMLIPRKGVNKNLVDLADQNARHLMESFLIESFEADERVSDPVYALGRDLGLTVVPRSMVCIDISTNQGKDTVGSLVWFEAGRPRKSEYRRFRIKGEQQNDFAGIGEVVTRYLTRRMDEKKQIPDLMLIDGGKGQLSAALEARDEVGAEVPLASIAKREEEIFLPGSSQPIRLPKRSPSLRLVQRIRDEAHRFAIDYNRKTRKKRTFDSELLNVPGVGPTLRRRLLEAFGSLAGIKLASAEEMAALPGMSLARANKIIDYLGVKS